MSDFYNDAERSGGRFHKLPSELGASIKGTITADPEKRAKTFEGKPVLNQKTGEQRYEYLVYFAVPAEDADDDGQRIFPLNERDFRAFSEAWKKAGNPRPLIGATFEAKVTGVRSKPTEPDDHAFRITPAPASNGWDEEAVTVTTAPAKRADDWD